MFQVCDDFARYIMILDVQEPNAGEGMVEFLKQSGSA
jgi:hypothetical protein